MALSVTSSVRKVGGITPAQDELICAFLQGAVYCWCKNRRDEWFALRDLMGGDNFFWRGTPLIVLWDKHNGRAADPLKEAAKDAGWLLKKVIDADRRTFESREEGLVKQYRWTGADGVVE